MAAGLAGRSGARWEAREQPGSSGNREVVDLAGTVGEDAAAVGGGRRCGP